MGALEGIEGGFLAKRTILPATNAVTGLAERRSQGWGAERSGAEGASNTLTRKRSVDGAFRCLPDPDVR